MIIRTLFELGIFLSVTVMKGEAEVMCGQRLAKTLEGEQVVWVREGNKCNKVYFNFVLTDKEWQRIAWEIRILREAGILEHLRQEWDSGVKILNNVW